MNTLARYLILAFTYQYVAYLFQHRHHHLVEKVVSLHIQICGVGRHSEAFDVLLHLLPALSCRRIVALQLLHPPCHLASEDAQRRLDVVGIEVSHLYDMQEIGYGELAIFSCAIEPDAPHEQRKYSERELAEVVLEVEYGVVVERNSHAHVVERGRVALQVLYGIGVGVEYVGTVEYGLRHRCGALYEIVVVGIDAGYHVAAHPTVEQTHQGRLLAALKVWHARGQHHFEVAGVVLKTRQHRPPEKHVVVALYVSHDAPAGFLRGHTVGCLEVSRRKIVFKSFTHKGRGFEIVTW